MQVNPYLFFDGKCEEALDFYKARIGAKVGTLMRFGEAPDQSQMNPDSKNKVMHSEFTVGETKIMASDGHCKGAPRFEGFSLTIQCANDAEAARLYNALSDGGQVTMPLGKTFFASSFGMVTDKYGIGWMVIAG
jgi:PhnB protein